MLKKSGFWDELEFGLTSDNSDFATALFSLAASVGELVVQIAAIYENRYGPVSGPPATGVTSPYPYG